MCNIFYAEHLVWVAYVLWEKVIAANRLEMIVRSGAESSFTTFQGSFYFYQAVPVLRLFETK
jgi:hypothetical protein